jgi:hypothetical protein
MVLCYVTEFVTYALTSSSFVTISSILCPIALPMVRHSDAVLLAGQFNIGMAEGEQAWKPDVTSPVSK